MDGTAAGIALGAAIAIAGPAMAAAIGQGMAASKAFESMARQPESANKIQAALLLSLALMEALGIYGLLIAILLQGKVVG
ncbi:MAG: ATP synthase F0 subunit C [Firmicutes bacterium]|nr:ATP synthase F0 subunit C [Bacillota bacterium]